MDVKLSRKQKREKYWLVNCFLSRVTTLHKRDKSLWAFAAWEGNQYEDNSRYLFEYINENHHDVNAVWLSENEDVVGMVRSYGYTAFKSSSKEGKKIQWNAGVVFFTHGVDDISNITYVYGAKLVALWHGIINKNGYYFDCVKGNMTIRNMLRIFKMKCYSATNRDITICSSVEDKKTIARTFHISPQNIIITGYPRNDALKKNQLISNVLLNMFIADDSKILLYMPTFRPYETNVIENCIKAMDHFLCEEDNDLPENAFIIVKLHYLTRIDYTPRSNHMLILEGKDITSVQDLLVVSQILITDYSSVCVDFAIMNKPVGLYAPDIDEYCEKNGITEYWKELCARNAFYSKEQLFEFLDRNLKNDTYTFSTCDDINNHYEADEISGTCFSENVYQQVYSKVRN